MSKAVKSYKGFNKDMTCRDFQYKEGKEYESKAKGCIGAHIVCAEWKYDNLNSDWGCLLEQRCQ